MTVCMRLYTSRTVRRLQAVLHTRVLCYFSHVIFMSFVRPFGHIAVCHNIKYFSQEGFIIFSIVVYDFCNYILFSKFFGFSSYFQLSHPFLMSYSKELWGNFSPSYIQGGEGGDIKPKFSTHIFSFVALKIFCPFY